MKSGVHDSTGNKQWLPIAQGYEEVSPDSGTAYPRPICCEVAESLHSRRLVLRQDPNTTALCRVEPMPAMPSKTRKRGYTAESWSSDVLFHTSLCEISGIAGHSRHHQGYVTHHRYPSHAPRGNPLWQAFHVSGPGVAPESLNWHQRLCGRIASLGHGP